MSAGAVTGGAAINCGGAIEVRAYFAVPGINGGLATQLAAGDALQVVFAGQTVAVSTEFGAGFGPR